MEVVIPMVGLGALYVISNQNKPAKENFKVRNANQLLPNTDVPNRNFPSEYPIRNVETDLTSKLSTDNAYDGNGVYTDKYFDPDGEYQSTISTSGNPDSVVNATYKSLTGQDVDLSYFRHNNTVPFFGSKSHMNNHPNATESTLDNYSGSGSQVFSKKEQSPMFSPDTNAQWAFGMPNASDFIQSRINPGMKMSNVKPFEEIRVAPGLGLGYTADGSDGYNSGVMARDQWKDKTVDELRVANKQKASGFTMLGFEGPAESNIKNRGMMGVMEKNRVDTTFEMGQDRLFVTTGLEKGQTLRAVPIERHVTRPDTASEYTGVAGFSNPAEYVKGEYMDSTNIELGSLPITPAYAAGKSGAYDADYESKSKAAYPNNRSFNTHGDQYYGIVGGAIGAAVAPLLDILRPSRRENTIGNLRPYQNAKTAVNNSYIFNPADRPAPTIRETTENAKQHLNVNANQHGGAYAVTDVQGTNTYRQETGDFYYAGNASAGSGARNARTYDAEYTQRNNDIKSSTIDGRLVPGNMALHNSDINMNSKAKDAYLVNSRPVHTDRSFGTNIPSLDTFGHTEGNAGLYQGIQYDRNNGDILSQLKSNPYTLSVIDGLR
jgi:hypothetical protein